MLRIKRVWKVGANVKGGLPLTVNRVLWECGDEIWERVDTEDSIRHYRVTSRLMMNSQVHETLVQLPESPIPLEALGRHSIGSEWLVEDFEELVSLAFPQELPSHTTQVYTPKMQSGSIPPQQNVPFVNQTSHEQQIQSDQGSQATTSSQPSYILPTELWSSLSQWIPPSALFQPSLHLLASSEWSDTPIPTLPPHSKKETYSRPGLTRPPYAKQHLPTRHDHPKRFSQPFQCQLEQKPLFI
jgi:hypothetical protein